MVEEERITINPKVMVGKLVIKGTRIPVDAIIKRLAQGMSTKEVLEEYPNLKEEDVRAAREAQILKNSLEREKKLVEHSIKKTREKLKDFENKTRD